MSGVTPFQSIGEGPEPHGKFESPTRLVSNLFWNALPWTQIAAEFGRPSVTDFGCGEGDYGILWDSFLPEGLGAYTGIDAAERQAWATKTAFHREFRLGNIDTTDWDATDLYFSQSALEHFEFDLSFMDRLQEKIAFSDRPSFQVHVFPASTQLLLTGPHGYRAYNSSMAKKLARAVPSSARVRLHGIGGWALNTVHFKYITLPKLTSSTRVSATDASYLRKLRWAIDVDSRWAKTTRGFSFLALTVENGVRFDLPSVGRAPHTEEMG